MIPKSNQQSTVCFGLAASLVGFVAPGVRAEIPVIGGAVSGQAAFFVPNVAPEGNVKLFDTAIQQLQIQTPNGTTSTAVFTPQAANFTDVDLSGTANKGDTGIFQGTLAGVAFSGGTPIGFTNRATVLNFTLNDFAANRVLDGSLIGPVNPGDAPLLFLPNVEATIAAGSDFEATLGDLEVGTFAANIDDGLIDLPSNFEFKSGGTVVIPAVSLERRIKFKFEGEDIIPEVGTKLDADSPYVISDDDDDLDDDALDDDDFGVGEIRFVGTANKKFQIQSVGTKREREFKIEGEFGSVDITLTDVEIKKDEGEIDIESPLDKYSIEGEGEGIFSVLTDDIYAFDGTARRETKFKFEQDDAKLEGRSEGDITFYAAAGLGSINIDDDFDDIDYIFVPGGSEGGNCNVCGNVFVFGTPIVFSNSTITVNQDQTFNLIVNGQEIEVDLDNFNTTVTNNISQNDNTFISIVNNEIINNFYIDNSSTLFTLNGDSSTANYTYEILVFNNQQVVNMITFEGDRYFVVQPGKGRGNGNGFAYGQNRRIWKQVGNGSRIFPGLVGLREISDDEAEELQPALVGLEEIDDNGDDDNDD